MDGSVSASSSRVLHNEHVEASGWVVALGSGVGGGQLYSTVCPA